MEAKIMVRQHRLFRAVREIVICHPRARNAMTYDMWLTLCKAVEDCHEDPTVQVVVVKSDDPTAFCAGGDITEFPTIRNNAETALAYNAATDAATRALRAARPITIAAVQGLCYGGGLQIASACDLRIANEDAVFAITPAKLGAVYGLYETHLLVRLVGEAKAVDMLATGRPLTASEALQCGLATLCMPNETYQVDFNAYIERLLSVAPRAQLAMKQMVRRAASGQVEDDLETKAWVDASLDGAEYQEGIRAFLEKRKPRFPGLGE